MEGAKMNGKTLKVVEYNLEFGKSDRFVNVFGCFKYKSNGNIYVIYTDVDTKYPIIYLIKQLRGLIKLKTSFFIKLMNDNYEGKYFTPVSLTAAETYRIIDPIQTIPAYLKKIFIKYEENHTCMDCDYSQVEARVFTSLAQDTALIEKLNRPWADYHREGGAFIFGTKP